jgi:Protein of unknown function (DUF1302)
MNTHNTKFTVRPLTALVVTALSAASLGTSLPALALDFKIANDTDAKLRMVFTTGTSIRTEGPEPAVLGTLSTARVGMAPGELGGNSGGNDLNFVKGRPVSTVIKGFFDFDVKRGPIGFTARASVWHDEELKNGNRPYGNIPNGFAQNVPLSDNGFDRAAKFSGAMFRDVFGYASMPVGADNKLDVRAGRQTVRWGVANLSPGSLNVVNPNDLPALSRPGNLPEELAVPLGMVVADFSAKGGWGFDAWSAYEFRPNVQNGCGTFLALANYAPPGCNFVNVLGAAGVNDPTALSSGRFPKRATDARASDSGQWGVTARMAIPSIGTRVRAYYGNYHSRASLIAVINPNIAGGYGANANVRLTDPNGLRYQMAYPEDLKIYGVSFETRVSPDAQVFGEVSRRPSQPLQISPSDLLAAFLNRNALSALQLNRNTLALPPGARFEGWDRYPVTNAVLGATFNWRDTLGAERITLRTEVGQTNISNLPDPGRLRYARSDDYGTAAVTGGAACVDNTVSRKTCPTEGFLTASAWGYRLRLSGEYPNAVYGATVLPALLITKDVNGYGFLGSYMEGRWIVRPSLRFDWKRVYVDLDYYTTGGGSYNTQIDRDLASVAVGLRF